MEKRLLQLLFLCIALVVIWNVWEPFWRQDLNEAVESGSTEKVVFEIEKGSTAEHIADDLEDADLIVSNKSFVRTVKSEELDGSLRYGRFVLSPGMTLREVITVLTTEGTGELAFTAIEGWTIADMDTELTEMGLIGAGAFEECAKECTFDYDFLGKDESLEGYLFPDTYFIDSATFSSENLINMMLQNFDSKLTDEMTVAIEASGRTVSEVVNVASMVEREVRTEDDLPIVAGIIWKRYDNDWYLGIDATLLYTQDDNELSAEDLAEDSPYNTRLNIGLPPTPISNPGLASLMATIYPEESDYYYYLTDSKGNVHYAKTNAEHEANKAEYLN
ncbi:MAG: endolytic transglycosylase MltG [Candidatus Gracilibacteria bacterium]